MSVVFEGELVSCFMSFSSFILFISFEVMLGFYRGVYFFEVVVAVFLGLLVWFIFLYFCLL